MAEKMALVVIDMQVAMVDDENAPHERETVLANVKALIARARAAGSEVIFVRHEHARYEPMMRGNPGWQIHPALAPNEGELIVDKRACDAFHDTPLQAELVARGIERLVISGMQTDYCVDTASRSALFRDYNVTLVGDGHTTWDNDILSAELIIAHHNKTLADLPHPTKEITVKPAEEIGF